MSRHDPKFYSSPAWRALRASVLRAYPRCQVPGCTSPATFVDHTVSRAAGGAALDPANCMAMCRSCHSRKTAGRDGAFGQRRDGTVRPKPGCDADGNPVNPAHRWNR